LENWDENSDRQPQIDLEARWIKQNGIICYGNRISRDTDFWFICRYAVHHTLAQELFGLNSSSALEMAWSSVILATIA
jgi:hypothetical protein